MSGLNQSEVIRMALEAEVLSKYESPTGFCAEAALKFAALVASAEREECAKACEDAITNDWEGSIECAKVIRARNAT